MSQGCSGQVEQGPASTRALEGRPERRPQVTPGAMFPETVTLTVFPRLITNFELDKGIGSTLDYPSSTPNHGQEGEKARLISDSQWMWEAACRWVIAVPPSLAK